MQKNGGETVEAYRAAMQSLRCCLRAEPDFPLGLFLLGMCYHRIGAEPIRASQLFHAAFASADALPRGAVCLCRYNRCARFLLAAFRQQQLCHSR